jgi:hypothetical protein
MIAKTPCPKCGYENELPACQNCGGLDFRRGPLSDGSTGMICTACNLGFSHTPCQSGCGAMVSASEFGTPVSRLARRMQEGMDAYQGGTPQSSKCFIATELYGCDSVEVAILRRFRDQSLLKSQLGAKLVSTYYRTAPTIIPVMRRSALLRFVLRALVTLSVKIVQGNSVLLSHQRRTDQTESHSDFTAVNGKKGHTSNHSDSLNTAIVKTQVSDLTTLTNHE